VFRLTWVLPHQTKPGLGHVDVSSSESVIVFLAIANTQDSGYGHRKSQPSPLSNKSLYIYGRQRFKTANVFRLRDIRNICDALSTRCMKTWDFWQKSLFISKTVRDVDHQHELPSSRSIRVSSDDLDWPWKTERSGNNYGRTDLLNYVCTVWRRTSKLGTVTRGEGRVSSGSTMHASSQGAPAQRGPLWDILHTPTGYDTQQPNFASSKLMKGKYLHGRPRPIGLIFFLCHMSCDLLAIANFLSANKFFRE